MLSKLWVNSYWKHKAFYLYNPSFKVKTIVATTSMIPLCRPRYETIFKWIELFHPAQKRVENRKTLGSNLLEYQEQKIMTTVLCLIDIDWQLGKEE